MSDRSIQGMIQNQLYIVENELYNCDKKYGTDAGGTKTLDKIYTVFDSIKNHILINTQYKTELPFDLGILTIISKFYLENENLTKEHMTELNNMYKQYNKGL